MPRFTRFLAIGLIASIAVAACDDGQPADAANDQVNSYGAYLAGLHADRINDAARSVEAFEKTLRKFPDDARLRRMAFYASMRAGRVARAVELASQIVVTQPGYMPANLVLVAAAMKQGEYKAALERAGRLPASGTFGFIRTLARAWAMVGAGQDKSALAEVDLLKSRSGLRVFYLLHRGLMLDVLGRDQEALAWYKKAYEDQRQPAIRFIQAAASVYARGGKRQDALKMIDTFISSRGDSYLMQRLRRTLTKGDNPPKIVSTAAEGLAELLMNLAGAMEQERSVRPALMWAQAALYLRPGDSPSQYLVGDLQRDLGQHEAAIVSLRKVKAEDPFSWEARKSLVSSLASLERNGEAAKVLEDMAKEEPTRWDALAMLGNLHRRQRNWAAAATAYDRAIKRIAKPNESHWNLYFSRGVAYERSKQWPKAEQDFRLALRLRPDQPSVLNYLAYSWVDRKQNLQEALGMLRKAVALQPRDGAIVDSLGWAYYRLGQFDRAVTLLERAAALSPQNWEINDHLGDAYWRTGRQAEARFQWQRSLSMEPDKEVLPKIKAKIANGLPALTPSEPTR